MKKKPMLLGLGMGAAFLVATLAIMQSTKGVPLPWKFKQTTSGIIETRVDGTPKVSVSFAGGHFARQMAPFASKIVQILPERGEKKIDTKTLVFPGASPLRLMNKLRKMKQLPQTLVYFLDSALWAEQLVAIKDLAVWEQNAATLSQPFTKTLFQLVPQSSFFLFKRARPLVLAETPRPVTFQISDQLYQRYLKVMLFYTRYNLRELLEFAESKNIEVILVEAPLPLLVPPTKICENAQVHEKGYIQLRTAIYQKNFKKAYRSGVFLWKHSLAHAGVAFYTGLAALRLGKNNEAFDYLMRASALDCARPPRIHPTFFFEIQRLANLKGLIYFETNKWLFQRPFIDVFRKSDGAGLGDQASKKKIAVKIGQILRTLEY